jgi:hypothetical protein
MSIANAHKNEQENVAAGLTKLTEFLQKRDPSQTNNLLTTLKATDNISQAHHELLTSYQKQFMTKVNEVVSSLDKRHSVTVDNKKWSCQVKLLEYIINTNTHEFIPHHELKELHTETVLHQKQLSLSRGMGGMSL